jgi:competence protein ComEA
MPRAREPEEAVPELPSSSTPPEPRRPPPDTGWRERLNQVGQRVGVDVSLPRVVLAAVAVAFAVVVVLYVLRPSASGPPVESTLPRASSAPSSAAPPTSASHLVVQAAGAVAKPGVYTVDGAARVNDLIAAAGGLASDADPDQVELAAPLTDGERVYVPRVGESPPPPVSSASGSTAPKGPIDLNRASAADLEALPGIGPALAQAIVDHREQNGPFHSVDELADVRGIGPAKMEQLRPLVKV